MDAKALRQLQELEEENRRLKQMYANLSLECQTLKDIVEKSYKPWGATRTGVLCNPEQRAKWAPDMSNTESEPKRVSLSGAAIRR